MVADPNQKAVCPVCEQWDQIIDYGFYAETRGRVRCKRLCCKRCKKYFPEENSKKAPSLKFRDEHLKAVAIFIKLPLPLERVAGVVGIRQETFRNKIMEAFKAGLWDVLEDAIVKKFSKIGREDMTGLFELCSRENEGESAFRSDGQLRGMKWRKLSENAQNDFLHKAAFLEF